ncbi:helix-turn-helix domain-containing protein [Enterococcus sp. CWB-B31]|uniref:helix-turn-helix domain-containing protein n=1 Tax=Enterococcus sp. CWB-B31 TaxID=2885159 RepID=UPI001E39C207|nr:winged helix-turn-helix domain-containing protein [Enterococcus sp. CWB-B31]MCB5953521.1 winged helix-turn-helix domain-containing protein [Enterococcus sp. CWB-B31]
MEELKKNEHDVRLVDVRELESAALGTNITIIYNDGKHNQYNEQNIGHICLLILKIREKTNSLLWIFSKEYSEIERLIYLNLGVNNNFDSRCSPEEFQLIVKNAINPCQINHEGKNISFHKEDMKVIKLNSKNQSLWNGSGKEIELTKLEYKLLSILDNASGDMVSYQELAQQLWTDSIKNEKARVANVVFLLRKKLEEHSNVIIRTVRSKGYRLGDSE